MGFDRNKSGRFFAPVKQGEELDVKIEAVGEKGDGIARKQGFVLFIPNAKEGDEVRVRVTRVLKKVGFAEVVGSSSGPVAASAPNVQTEEEDIPYDPSKESEDFGEEDDSDYVEQEDDDYGDSEDTTEDDSEDTTEDDSEDTTEDDSDKLEDDDLSKDDIPDDEYDDSEDSEKKK